MKIDWKDVEEWHDDDGCCLFIFFDKTDKSFFDCMFTAPNCSDWPSEMQDGKLYAFFKPIDETGLKELLESKKNV